MCRHSRLACRKRRSRRQALNRRAAEQLIHPREVIADHAFETNVASLRVEQPVNRLAVHHKPDPDARPHRDVCTGALAVLLGAPLCTVAKVLKAKKKERKGDW